MLQLHRIAACEKRSMIQIKPEADIAANQLAVQQADSRSDKVIDVDAFHLPLALFQKTAETMDDLAGAIVLMNNILKCIANFDKIRRILRQEMEGRLRIRQDRGERLVNFVRNGAGKFAEHGNPHQMLDFQTLQCGLSLGRLLFGDVDENAPLLF